MIYKYFVSPKSFFFLTLEAKLVIRETEKMETVRV